MCRKPVKNSALARSDSGDRLGRVLRPAIALFVITWIGVSSGCSGAGDRLDIGEVTGLIIFDGKPLANASVAFSQQGFRPTVGTTDAQGRYELVYIRDIKGPAVGKHTVRIKQFDQDADPIPRRYNYDSEVTADVDPGQNAINFDLKSSP